MCKNNFYERFTTLSLETFLPFIAPHIKGRKKTVRELVEGQNVGVNSLRLQTFYLTGTQCYMCGLKASYFAIERNVKRKKGEDGYHVNLYGVKEGEEVLFTHDHVTPRCHGGANNLHNTVTACGPCNWLKGSTMPEDLGINPLTFELSLTA